VQQQIGFGGLLQGGLKSLNQAVWQVTDEANRVRQRDRATSLTQIQLAGGGVEGGKELVGSVGARLDQGIEERGFASVGVAHQRDLEGLIALALAALGIALFLDLDEPFLGALDGLPDHAAVQFDLGFAWTTAQTDPASLALQVGPAPHQARAQVLQTGQFNLQFALVAARALGKYFEDQQGAVIDRQPDVPLQIALLRRAQRLIKEHLLGAMQGREFLDLVGLAAAHEQCRIGCLALAGQTGHRLQPARLGQQPEFDQAFVKMRQTKINADQKGRRCRRLVGVSQSVMGLCAEMPRRPSVRHQLAASPVSWALRLTARPGTIVEMACL